MVYTDITKLECQHILHWKHANQKTEAKSLEYLMKTQYQSRIICPLNIQFKKEGVIKNYLDKERLQEFTNTHTRRNASRKPSVRRKMLSDRNLELHKGIKMNRNGYFLVNVLEGTSLHSLTLRKDHRLNKKIVTTQCRSHNM